jgi:beta-carotene ketolase (CrtW type)
VLAAAIILAWLSVHAVGVFLWDWTTAGIVLAPVLVAVQSWLCVGLFIVAHDCMHGTLAPGQARVNAAIGQLCLGLYAGFDYASLLTHHRAHHREPGTAADPDFCPEAPRSALAWYGRFLRTYMSWRNVLFMSTVFSVEHWVLGAATANQLVFWALPAAASSFQLFWFGTFLPHRAEDAGFADRHRARSSDFSWLLSLLTCFHFGYHHEHHLHPYLPWWALPRARRLAAEFP